VSHSLTLLFLAVWHGIYSGYFACFGFEFFCVMAEKQVSGIFYWLIHCLCLRRRSQFQTAETLGRWWALKIRLSRRPVCYVVWVLRKLLTYLCLAFGLLPFALLSFRNWWKVTCVFLPRAYNASSLGVPGRPFLRLVDHCPVADPLALLLLEWASKSATSKEAAIAVKCRLFWFREYYYNIVY